MRHAFVAIALVCACSFDLGRLRGVHAGDAGGNEPRSGDGPAAGGAGTGGGNGETAVDGSNATVRPDGAPDGATAERPSPEVMNMLETAPVRDLTLAAYWKLDEGMGLTTTDSSGNGAGGTLLPTPKPPMWTRSTPGVQFADAASLVFDGQNYVELAVKSLPPLEQIKTIALWVRIAVASTARMNFIVLRVDDLAQGLQLGLYDGLLCASNQGGKLGGNPCCAPIPGPAAWHHVALTIPGGYQLYVDGRAAGSSAPFGISGSITTARLGANLSQFLEGYVGALDDVRLYTRALSATEVAALAAGQP